MGSAEDEKYDQVLESVMVGPVNIGNYRFVFQVSLVFVNCFLCLFSCIAVCMMTELKKQIIFFRRIQ